LSSQLGPGVWTRLRYDVRDAEGESLAGAPAEMGCVFGYGALLPSLEQALEGLEAGDRKSVTLRAKDAFGERDPKAFVEFDRSEFPEGVSAGDRFEAEQADGTPMSLQVLDVDEERVVVDLNHPLAGQSVRFDIEVLEARPATDAEIRLAESRLEEDEESEEPQRTGLNGLLSPESLLRPRTRR
jgi:FKBP-type peptidyl-prolyl cis-trans isomerase SlyD